MNSVEKVEGIIKDYKFKETNAVREYSLLEIGDNRLHDIEVSFDIDYIERACQEGKPLTLYVSTIADKKGALGIGYAGKAYIKGEKQASKAESMKTIAILMMAVPILSCIMFIQSSKTADMFDSAPLYWFILMLASAPGFFLGIPKFLTASHLIKVASRVRSTVKLANEDKLEVIHIT